MKNFFKRNLIQFKILGMFMIMAILVCASFYPLMPFILNYPPNTYNNSFQWELEGANYTLQFVQISLCIFVIYTIIVFSKLSFLYGLNDALKNNNTEKLEHIREKLFTIPDELFLLQIIVPSFGVPILHWLSTSLFGITTLKIFIIYSSFITVIATLSAVYTRKLFAKILENINVPIHEFKHKSPLSSKMYYQIIPLFIVALLITSLVGYSSVIKETSDTSFNAYKTRIDNALNNSPINSEAELFDALRNITFISSQTDKVFVVKPDGNYYNINNQPEEYSDFWIKYINEFSSKDNSIVYDYYGVDVRGAISSIEVNGETYIVGVQYDLTSAVSLTYLGVTFISLLALNILTLSIFSKSLSNDVSTVARSLSDIANTKSVEMSKNLPITSNDEIGELVVAFNSIQDLTKQNIAEIKDNEQSLMEKERLASLGQLIGGIAHNLKTPIMSIAGASEGLTELVSEYIASISNPSVTAEDHKEIAKDMLEWITKIKTHTAYMSDIITTVKGQAVQLSGSEYENFTIYDLARKVEILIKHEIKKALLTLNIDIKCDPGLILNGDINNLIQVINNLITNSIHSYNGEPDGTIDFIIDQVYNSVQIVIADNGCGIPQKIKDKLFKEMVTTKGKNGSGLGLYMSYSTIKGKFNGAMTFESEEGKGTKFIITIPIK